MKNIIPLVLLSSISFSVSAMWQCGAVNGYGAWSDSVLFDIRQEAVTQALSLCNESRRNDEPICYINYCDELSNDEGGL